MQNSIIIRPATMNDFDGAVTLAWKTFLKYEAKDYGREGTVSFQNFLSDNLLRRMFILGEYPIYIAILGEEIVGMIGLRNQKHISLLFVDGDFHRQGIGKALIEEMISYIQEAGENSITVNAAPFAVGFYHKLGFEDVAPELMKEGIRYTPMEKHIFK